MSPRVAELMDLSHRRALVTGGAGHIGRTVCETLLELGADVAPLDLDEGRCVQAAEGLALSYPGRRVVPVAGDLTSEEDTRRTVRRAAAELGGLDILVHCAAYTASTALPGWVGPLEDQSVQRWDNAVRVGVASAFVAVQELRDVLAVSGHGSVILLGSIYGVVGPDRRLYEGTEMANPIGYGVTKGAVLQLMRYLAVELAPRIRVNTISPGGVWRGQPQLFVDRYVSRTPLGRMARESDLKGAIAFLASDLSAYVTGHNLLVDGGWTVW